MSLQIPAPVQILQYPLPDGSFVHSEEEYIAAVTGAAASRLAGAYVKASGDTFAARGQAVRVTNLLIGFLKWQTVHNYKGTLEGVLAEYDAFLAEEANKVPVAPEVPAAPVEVAEAA